MKPTTVNRLQQSLLFVAVFTAAVVAVFRLTDWYLQDQQTEGIRVQLQELDRQLSNRAQLPTILSSDPRILEALSSDSAEAVQAANVALQLAQEASEVAFVFLLNQQGVTIASSNWSEPLSFVGEYYGFRPYFTEAISGRTGTFFAVGATTGIPGYFIAKPVGDPAQPAGVIVVKTELQSLLSSWVELGVPSMVTDEFGVVILSTDPRFLYAPTHTVATATRQTINSQRRYFLSESARFEVQKPHQWIWRDVAGATEQYRSVTESLTSESWQLHRLIPVVTVMATTLAVVAAALVCAAFVYLLWRGFRYQREQVERERQTAEQLEHEIRLRTAELESAQKDLIAQSNFAMLGRMSAAINHEINQPLASLRLNLAALRAMVESPEVSLSDVTDSVVDCDRTTKRISRVIETLRSLTRKDNTLFDINPMSRLIDDVVETIRNDRPLVSQHLSVDNQTRQLQVNGNETLLQQALLNLLYNAFDATLECEDPQVRLTVQAEGDSVVIRVTDNGAGVAESVAGELFTPFTTDTRRKSGLGLGLTLARQIVEDHQGSLCYYPNQPNGSIFELSLPLV